jgi:hypothetical protein
MDIYDYNRLTLGEKASLLWQQAQFIERHAQGDLTSCLYHINNFFIEAVVSHRENRIVDVTPFKLSERLDKYVEAIDLRELPGC